MNDLDFKALSETLLLVMEECSEVTQACSKIIRFGLDNSYDGVSNRDHLQTEIGDLTYLFTFLMDKGIIDSNKVADACRAKQEKLKRWTESGLFN
jgi:NTP pyrophosphatase (non-canonical NTP hydrolase)